MKGKVAPILLILCIGAGLVVFKIHTVGLTPNGDYDSYLETAQLFRGAPDAIVSPNRILKPLNPLIIAIEENVMMPETAFLTQIIVFYFLLLIACYAFGRAFNLGKVESVMLTLVLGASYPVLKYGIDLYTETGALFFYIASLTLTLWYLRVPSKRVLLANVAVLTVGFLWKEYSVVSAIIFGFAILFHPELSWRARFKDLAMFAGIFVAVNLLWQMYVYFTYHYTYLSWYQQGGSAGFESQFTLKNLVKSTGAILGLAWLLVPFELRYFKNLAWWQKRFLVIAVPASLMVFFWGYVSSRLFFVMAPAFALVAVLALTKIKNSYLRYGIFFIILAGNIVWLVMSGRMAA
jgi:hypothetical protein